MRLVDDVMEPFRPLVDAWVRRLSASGIAEVNSESKRALGLLPVRSLRTRHGISPVAIAVQRLCISLAQKYEESAQKLDLPLSSAEDLASIFDECHGSDTDDATG